MVNELKIWEWNHNEDMTQYIVRCNVSQNNDLFNWCEDNFERHSLRPYILDWKWTFGGGPDGTMIYTFRYPEDAMAFKLRWG